MPRDNPWTPDLIQRLRDGHAAGYSFEEIGRRVGMSKCSCIGKARRLGLDQRPGCVKTIGQERLEMAQNLIRQGVPAVEVAGAVGINPDTVRGIRKRMGIEAPPRPKPRQSTGVVVLRPPAPVPRPVIVAPKPRPAPAPLRIDATRVCEWLDGPRHHYVRCGAPAVGGTSRCAGHLSICFVRRDRDRAA